MLTSSRINVIHSNSLNFYRVQWARQVGGMYVPPQVTEFLDRVDQRPFVCGLFNLTDCAKFMCLCDVVRQLNVNVVVLHRTNDAYRKTEARFSTAQQRYQEAMAENTFNIS